MLKVNNLHVGILQDIHFHVDKGECFAVVGASGSGKSTLLNAIAGYVNYQGEIWLNGQNLQKCAPWQRNCRYLNQFLYLFPHKTVLGNLDLAAPHISLKEKMQLLEKLHISPLAERYPTALSGGEKQRAALARALINPPDLLLLDEPFSALDWDIRQQIWLTLQAILQESQITTLLVSHEPKETAFLAQRILFLQQGQQVNLEKIEEQK